VATCFDTTGAGQAAWYDYRWVRVSTLNQSDPRNISAKLREGYEPVRIEEQPQFQLFIDPNSRFQRTTLRLQDYYFVRFRRTLWIKKEIITLRKIKTKWNL
jgi:hypothetical protein